MEGVWLKTEPIDDSFDEDFSIELEQGIAEPLTIIEQDESKSVFIKSNDDLEEIENKIDPIQKFDVKKGVKKSRHKIPQRKQKSDAEKVENKSADKKPKQRRKPSTPVKKSYICDECGKEFTGASGLNRHKLLHSGLRPFICPEANCGAAFSQSSTLKSHQMSHTGERKFFCEECGQGFLSKFHMQIHQRSKHSGERPFVCKECGQGFARKQSLTRHELEHTGEKPYECDDCGMRFYERILLRSHKKTHTADGKPFTCAECGKGFYHKTSLNAHKRNHSTVRPFGCEVCGKRFTQKGTLNIHKVIHSDVRPFECEECGLRFTQKYTLKTHRMKQHGLSTTSQKQQKPIHTGLSAPVTESRSHNDKILRNELEPKPSEELEINVSMSPTTKSIFPLSGGNLNESKERACIIESAVMAQQPEETNEIGRSSPASQSEPSDSEDDFMVASNDDESIGFEHKFVVDPSVDALQSQSIEPIDGIATNLYQIKEEPLSSEPYVDIWKSERTTPDDEYVNVSEKPAKKPAAKKSAREQSTKLPFACGKCERTFALVGALKNHQRSHKFDNMEREKKTFICEECGKVFAGKQHLQIHKRIHSGATPYSCKECDKSFTQLGNLKSHQLTHTGERPFTCETCGMTFSKKNTLDKHKRTHTDDRNFECDVCGRKFKHPSSIKRHKLSHTGEKNYGCDICGKTFIEKSYIKFHLRTHTGYKPFACDECPSTFVDKSQLTQHKGYSHRRVGEPSPYRRRKLMKMMKMMNNSL